MKTYIIPENILVKPWLFVSEVAIFFFELDSNFLIFFLFGAVGFLLRKGTCSVLSIFHKILHRTTRPIIVLTVSKSSLVKFVFQLMKRKLHGRCFPVKKLKYSKNLFWQKNPEKHGELLLYCYFQGTKLLNKLYFPCIYLSLVFILSHRAFTFLKSAINIYYRNVPNYSKWQ